VGDEAMVKKYILIICIFLLFLLLITACQKHDPIPIFIPPPDQENQTNETSVEFEMVTLTQNGEFSREECEKRGLNDKVIMLSSRYCGHCKATQPLFQEACEENGVEPIILDVSVPAQRRQMESHGINIIATPTYVFGCMHYIGARQKQGYLSLLDKFLQEVRENE